MKRSLLGAFTVFCVLMLVFTSAEARKKRKKRTKKPPPPISLQVGNACAKPLKVVVSAIDMSKEEAVIGSATYAIKATSTSDAQSIDGKGSTVFKLSLGGKQGALPYVFFQPGGSYQISLHNCRMNAADIVTRDLGVKLAKTAKKANLRVRASRPGKTKLALIEYQAGGKGRFKRMSLAPSKPLSIGAGTYEYGLRVKAGRKGPIINNIKKKAKIEAGHNYLIEAWAIGKEIFVKVEDEGTAKPGKKSRR